ncbi:hypothetical protein QA601_17505 [Chitinispirillales bacterium ANBcel5]|uniref:hypothetical protein n=1 Tax=Cellulosispirillum alkaliphilum TaxID=3039283 RepID=UPI002A4EC70B|nr:hypothetical protein [Chitinispirillales bacterium ANBcel5]
MYTIQYSKPTITYDRDIGTNFDAYYHRIESHMRRVFGNWTASPYDQNSYENKKAPKHLWDEFSMVKGTSLNDVAGCGVSHYSPNSESTQDNYVGFQKNNSFYSFCEDWRENYPNLTYTATFYPVAKDVWGSDPISFENGYRHGFFKNWLLPSIPNRPGRFSDDTNQINNNKLNNWWEYIYNYNKYPESR